MPKFLWLVALVGLVVSLGQDVQWRPRFLDGDEFTIEMVRTVEERMDTVQTHSIARTVHIKVVSTTPDGIVLQWRPGPAQIKGEPINADARMALVLLAATDHDFLLALDAYGQYRRMTNTEALAASLDRAREAMRAKVPAIDDPRLASLPKLTASNVASAVGQDAEIFTGLYGLSQPVGQELERPVTVPMPGGGIPGVRRFQIVSASEEKAEATMTLAVDQAALRKAIPGGMEYPSIKFDLSETARYVFDRRVGLNRAGTMDRTLISGPDRRIERWEFSLTSAPKR